MQESSLLWDVRVCLCVYLVGITWLANNFNIRIVEKIKGYAAMAVDLIGV